MRSKYFSISLSPATLPNAGSFTLAAHQYAGLTTRLKLTSKITRGVFATLTTVAAYLLAGCTPASRTTPSEIVVPLVTTEPVEHNSDDAAIWIDPTNPGNSLILGTDKGKDGAGGALFVFGLDGKEKKEKTVHRLQRPNNVDVGYGLALGEQRIDVAVCTERNAHALRVFRLPTMEPIDGGGIPVFEGDSLNLPMGIALFTDANGNLSAIVSRKNGPTTNYLWQYSLTDNQKGAIEGKLIRKFGTFSGKKEIEAIAVDSELGYVYYSDEGAGIRKYYAHPDSANTELAFFASNEFKGDIEGISIYREKSGKGYLLVSDQQANQFHLFAREGSPENPHAHPLLKTVRTATMESDGSDVTSVPLPGFPQGLFVAMSNPVVFQIYRWEQMIGNTPK